MICGQKSKINESNNHCITFKKLITRFTTHLLDQYLGPHSQSQCFAQSHNVSFNQGILSLSHTHTHKRIHTRNWEEWKRIRERKLEENWDRIQLKWIELQAALYSSKYLQTSTANLLTKHNRNCWHDTPNYCRIWWLDNRLINSTATKAMSQQTNRTIAEFATVLGCYCSCCCCLILASYRKCKLK